MELPCQCGILNSMPPVRLPVHATERGGPGRRRPSCSSHDFGLEGRRSTWPRHCRIETMIRLEQPSRYAAERYLIDLRDALEAIRRDGNPKLDSVAWPAGLDRSILNGLNIGVRTRNCLLQAKLMEGDDPLTVQQLLRLPSFGKKSLNEMLITLEKFLKECIRTGTTDSRHINRQTGESPNVPLPLKPDVPMTETSETSSPLRGRAGMLLSSLLATAAELHGTETLADTLDPKLMRLASRMGIANEIATIRIGDIVNGTPGFASVVSSRLKLILEATSENERTIIEHRLLRAPPKTLEDIGSLVGVTRERIRQIQSRVEGKIRMALGRELRVIAWTLKEQLGHMIPECEFERRIEELLPDDPPLVKRLFRQTLITAMGYTLQEGVYLDKRASRVVEEIDVSARKLADDVGLVDSEQLIAELPGEDWRRFWPWLQERCRLHDLYGSLGIRDSAKARAKAALLSIGRPATREEIAAICGLEETRIGGHLSNIASVARADKDRWGLKEWIDDEYDGIVGEIVQRIAEDGGITTTDRLLRELPGQFNVSANSVRAYMQTPKFVIRNGCISMANVSSLQLRHLDDVIDGRDDNGSPYSRFTVEARFFDGYSVTGIPPEFAKALGCKPDEGKFVRIANLPGCRDLSIRWPLASTTGASLGYLADPLRQLGVQPGQRVRVTIRGLGLVDLTVEDDRMKRSSANHADTILARMKDRRRAL